MFNIRKKGKKAGNEDALENKTSNPNRHLPILPAIFIPGYTDIFLEAYSKGYKEGTWERQRQERYETEQAKKLAKMKEAYQADLKKSYARGFLAGVKHRQEEIEVRKEIDRDR